MFSRGDFVRLPKAHNPRIIGIVTSSNDENPAHIEVCMVAWPMAGESVFEFASTLVPVENPTGIFAEMLLADNTIRPEYAGAFLWPEK